MIEMLLKFTTAMAWIMAPLSAIAVVVFCLPPRGKGDADNAGCFLIQCVIACAWLLARYCL